MYHFQEMHRQIANLNTRMHDVPADQIARDAIADASEAIENLRPSSHVKSNKPVVASMALEYVTLSAVVASQGQSQELKDLADSFISLLPSRVRELHAIDSVQAQHTVEELLSTMPQAGEPVRATLREACSSLGMTLNTPQP